jgi:hypothetical protein
VSRPRSSVFGPLALIGLGVLLLLHNLSGYSFWTPLLDYWPWFLVAWGTVHVIQQVIARSTGSAPPRRLAAGAVLVGLLICLAGVSARSIRANDGVLFRGFGVQVRVRDSAFRSPPETVRPQPPPPNESP